MRTIVITAIACVGLMLSACGAESSEPASAPEPASTFVVPTSPPVATPAARSTPTASARAKPARSPQVGDDPPVASPDLRRGQWIDAKIAASVCRHSIGLSRIEDGDGDGNYPPPPSDPTAVVVCGESELVGGPRRIGVVTNDAAAQRLATRIGEALEAECPSRIVITVGMGPSTAIVVVARNGETTRYFVSPILFAVDGTPDSEEATTVGQGCGPPSLATDVLALVEGRGATVFTVPTER